MNFVTRFESFIERLMERTFTRAARSPLQPVEIGKRLVRAMEAEQSVGVEGVLVPNVYEVFLSSYDYAHFEPMHRSFAQNMEAHLARAARQHRFHMVSRPLVRLHVDDTLSHGDISIETHLKDVEPREPALKQQHTAVMPQIDHVEELVAPTRPTNPSLVLATGRYAILRSPTRLGRLPDNDIVINDRRVSRHHAEVAQGGKGWMIRDRGSTNGTSVNGRLVKEATLRPGDTISFGGLEATWEQ